MNAQKLIIRIIERKYKSWTAKHGLIKKKSRNDQPEGNSMNRIKPSDNA